MDVKKLALLIGALVIAVITAVMAKNMFAGAGAQQAAAAPAVPVGPKVLVAKKALPVGTIIDADSLTLQPWPKELMQGAYYVEGSPDTKNLQGTVVRYAIAAGQPLKEVEALLTNPLSKAGIRLVREDADGLRLKGDLGQLKQVLINLIQNAADSTDSGGTVIYDVYRPSNYSALGFASPIVTWGNGTGASPAKVSDFLSHLASYGFTVIASTLPNTGSGNEIDAAAHYLVTQNGVATSVYHGHLNTGEVASVGTSQGAGGAVQAATKDPALIKTVMTFSLPNAIWAGSNPDCPTVADCTANPAALTQPVFFASTYGFWDSIIASPATEKAYFNSTSVHAALGIILTSDGKLADHTSIQDTADGGNPGGFFGYATAWLEYQLRGNATAAGAFTGPHPELLSNINWPGSAVK